MVAARRLRKSTLANLQDTQINIYGGNDLENYNNKIKDKYEKKCKISKSNFEENEIYIEKFKYKIIIKCFFASLILFLFIISKIFFFENLMGNKTIKRIYEHTEFDFSKELVLDNIESYLIEKNHIIEKLVPMEIITYIKNKYESNFKEYFLNFKLLDFINNSVNNNVDIYEEEISIYSEEDNEMLNDEIAEISKVNTETMGIGGAEEYTEINEEITVINYDEMTDEEYFNSLNLQLINPTVGIVSSPFGDREVIFEGVNPYHTGIDIANVEGTGIISACEGKVISTVYDNIYYGNYIEIQIEDVVFKYAHLSEILINVDDVIEKGQLIGLMGSTGYSTGPHLHFEINIRGNKVDPEIFMEF